MTVAKAESSVANMGSGNNALAKVSTWTVRLREYYDDLRGEMQRVTWPSWSQVRATTAVVIAAVFAFAAYFALVDVVLGRAIQRLFSSLAK
ncbi:MAG: preprotein translocase subunit SecE [Bryobacterales bacterium]|nr:preprotein translocase subunit SecE [Bryobacterales bacterium]